MVSDAEWDSMLSDCNTEFGHTATLRKYTRTAVGTTVNRVSGTVTEAYTDTSVTVRKVPVVGGFIAAGPGVPGASAGADSITATFYIKVTQAAAAQQGDVIQDDDGDWTVMKVGNDVNGRELVLECRRGRTS